MEEGRRKGKGKREEGRGNSRLATIFLRKDHFKM